MKKLIPALVASILFIGCGPKTEEKTPEANSTSGAASGNPLTAPVDYLGAVANAKKRAEKTVDTVALNQAIQMFYAQEDRYPKDLHELVAQKYLPSLPAPPAGMKIIYDSRSGEARIVRQ